MMGCNDTVNFVSADILWNLLIDQTNSLQNTSEDIVLMKTRRNQIVNDSISDSPLVFWEHIYPIMHYRNRGYFNSCVYRAVESVALNNMFERVTSN